MFFLESEINFLLQLFDCCVNTHTQGQIKSWIGLSGSKIFKPHFNSYFNLLYITTLNFSGSRADKQSIEYQVCKWSTHNVTQLNKSSTNTKHCTTLIQVYFKQTHLLEGRQAFCIASTVYRKNSWASSWFPHRKCFAIPKLCENTVTLVWFLLFLCLSYTK